MDTNQIGIPTYHARVERWECDYNDHWNTRYYGRTFQIASDCLAIRAGAPATEAILPRASHIRYHRELRVSAPVEVRSAALTGAGALDGAVVHLLYSAGMLAATGLDVGGHSEGLPKVTPDQVPLAVPRSLGPDPVMAWDDPSRPWHAYEIGPVERDEIDRNGLLRLDRAIRASSIGESGQLHSLGLTPEWASKSGINRMGVEVRVVRHAAVAPDTLLRDLIRWTDIEGKRFRTQHRLVTHTGALIATIELCVLTVDLNTRRAVDVPDFLRAALG